MLKPGSIKKIIVKDFVTYSYVEVHPGPNLNMLIGPNGTGKSTIVAAIILGLGGSPKTVGRGTKISDYVKHNCTEATIEILLQDNDSTKHISISRCFNHHDKSEWFLDGIKLPFKEVEVKIKQFNIQVDNLCQFLPQDRVQEFARLNKQQLLQQTQIAVGRSDLIDKQLNLIKVRERHKELQSSLENVNSKLQELQDANIRIEGKIRNLKKKKKYLKSITDIDRKTAWITYDTLQQKVQEIKADIEKAVVLYNKHKDALKPINKAISNAIKVIADIQQKVANKRDEVNKCEVDLKNEINACNNIKLTIARILGDLNSKLREIEVREQEVAEATEQSAQINAEVNRLLERYGDDIRRQHKMTTYNENITKLSTHINTIIEKKGTYENNKTNKIYELRKIENELSKIENIKHLRMEWLRRVDKNAYAAIEWLRSNKHMFKGEIFEPMMLEINVLSPQHAVYVENVIPLRDKIAFTCVLKEDMNLMLRTLNKLKLDVNVVCSSPNDPGSSSYRPSLPIEQLKIYGMVAHVRSLIMGPEPIMKYLCKYYQIHNIPVGTSITNQLYDKLPNKIKMFFSDKYKYTTSISKYTGQKSTMQSAIKSDGSLSISLDAARMEDIRAQLDEVKREARKCDDQMEIYDTQISKLQTKQRELRSELKEIQTCKQTLQTLQTKMQFIQNKIQQLQQNTTTKEQLQNESDSQVVACVKQMVTYQSKILEAFKNYSSKFNESKLDKLHLETAQKQITFLENKFQDTQKLCAEAEQTMKRVKDSCISAKNNAKTALLKAKQLSKGFTPNDDGFDEFREAYNTLSNTLNELETEKEHILSKIDCLNTANVEELQQYENRLEQLAKLQTNVKEKNTELDNINSNIDQLQQEWLKPLQVVISKINTKFSESFRRLGCVGEISVFTGENEKEFAEYGLSIKVKYRDAEQLQELNHIVQSGGERAVATAAFMLSLQELTPVPFRCVDEINQGMDSHNERRIFELLVEATSQKDTSQYFFITPKLVPKLKFVRTIKIHIVHNGPFIPKQKQWNKVFSSREDAITDT